MFKKDLTRRLEKIFGLKVSYDAPGESKEQECLFVHIERSGAGAKPGLEHARVEGNISVFVNGDKMPFGFFLKRINAADPDITRDLFFHNIETNDEYRNNLVMRGADFIFLYSAQYDPDQGSLNELSLEE